MILVQRTIKEYKTKRNYSKRRRFLKEFLESDMDACVVDNWELNYKKARYCATSLQDGVKKFFNGLLEVHMIDGEVWIIKTSAIKK